MYFVLIIKNIGMHTIMFIYSGKDVFYKDVDYKIYVLN